MRLRTRLKLFCGVIILSVLVVGGMVFSPDALSAKLRTSFEYSTNSYIERLAQRASTRSLSTLDKTALSTATFLGISVSRLRYPEAAALLHHYIHGDGSELELDSDYFQQSKYLRGVIEKLGQGEHGPIALNQSEDWRLSLALNPYYLNITEQTVRLYHPQITFAEVDSELVYTIVPIGKLRLKVYDNLVSALDVSPFYVYSQWSRGELNGI